MDVRICVCVYIHSMAQVLVSTHVGAQAREGMMVVSNMLRVKAPLYLTLITLLLLFNTQIPTTQDPSEASSLPVPTIL